MNEKEIRIELKRLVKVDVKQSEFKESKYPHLEKLVSKLIKKSSK